MPHVHVDEVARSYTLAMDTVPAGQHLLAAAPGLGVNEVVVTIARTRGRAGRIRSEPADATPGGASTPSLTRC